MVLDLITEKQITENQTFLPWSYLSFGFFLTEYSLFYIFNSSQSKFSSKSNDDDLKNREQSFLGIKAR
jgi:hypothetical protein